MKTVKEIKPRVNRLTIPELEQWLLDNKKSLTLPAVSYVRFRIYQLSPKPKSKPQPVYVNHQSQTDDLVEIFGGPLFTME